MGGTQKGFQNTQPSYEDPSIKQCPNCMRKFNEDAAERHFPVCAKKAKENAMKNKKPAYNPTLQKAKTMSSSNITQSLGGQY